MLIITELNMDFIDKKEKLADLLEEYINNCNKKNELIDYVKDIKGDNNFQSKNLFLKIFSNIEKHLDDFSRKELKQRVLLIRSYLD